MANILKQKTIFELESFDPLRNLWRNVLIVAIEDAIKEAHLKRDTSYQDRRFSNMDYFTIPNRDYAFVCQQAGLNHHSIRRNILNMFEDISNFKEVSLPWKRLSRSEKNQLNYWSRQNHDLRCR